MVDKKSELLIRKMNNSGNYSDSDDNLLCSESNG